MTGTIRRLRWAVLAAAFVAFPLAAQPASAAPVPYVVGDVFAGVGNGKINHFSPTGVLKNTLDTASGSVEDTGMCFDQPGNLYATNWTAGTATKFDNAGTIIPPNPWTAGYLAHPESCVVNGAGDVWVGSVDPGDLRRYSPAGALLETDHPLIGPRGVDWIDLASDQCTMFYTSESADINRYNVCTHTQVLAPFNTVPLAAPCYALRIRANGEVLVACQTQVYRLSSSGAVMQMYPAAGFTPSAAFLFALNLDPNGTSFWTGDYLSGQVYKINIATGATETSFSSQKNTTLAGLAVFGEPTAAAGCPRHEDEDEAEHQEMDKLNHERAMHGLPALRLNTGLTKAARKHSCDRKHHDDHGDRGDHGQHGSDGSMPRDRVAAEGVPFLVVGESDGYASGALADAISTIHVGLLADPFTVANTLNPAFTQVGIGVVYENGKMFLTEDFVG